MNEFDSWRDGYSRLTYKDQQKIYDVWVQKYPEQKYFNVEYSIQFFELAEWDVQNMRVFEFGGWMGELAQLMIPKFPQIKKWTNCDIAPSLREKQVFFNPVYDLFIPNDFIWNLGISKDYNIFYSSHTIEHITAQEFELLIKSLPKTIKWIYLQAPLKHKEPSDWFHSLSSHINTLSWDNIIDIIGASKYYKYTLSPEDMVYYFKML